MANMFDGNTQGNPVEQAEKKRLEKKTLQQAVGTTVAEAPTNLADSIKTPVPSQAQATVATPVGGGFVPSPEQALDRKVIQGMISDFAKNVPKFDADKVNADMDAVYDKFAPGSPAEQKATQLYKTNLQTLASELRDLRNKQTDEVAKNEWMQAAENLGNAVAQLGAGLYGAKHGVDLSGVKFNKTDWEGRLKNRLGLVESQVDDLRRQQGQEYEGMKEARQGLKERAGREANTYQEASRYNQETQKEMARTALNASIDVYKSQVVAANANARMANSLGAQAAKMNQHQGEQALKELDKNYKENGNKLQGLDEAISILENQKEGNLKEDPATQQKLDVALKKAGLSAADLPKVEFSLFSPSTWTNTAEQKAGLQMLQSLKSKMDDSFKQIDSAHQQVYQKVTGQVRPEGMRYQFGKDAGTPPEASGRVVVQDASGKKYSLPRTQLQEALGQGYTEVK